MSSFNKYPITHSVLRWLEHILSERFGHTWHLMETKGNLRLQLECTGGAVIFDSPCKSFTEAHSNQPFTQWNGECEGWSLVLDSSLPAPGVDVLPSPLIEQCGDEHIIHYDILGLTYWMLTRMEEVGRMELDSHQRFPATSSHAFKHGYLDRPVVDEWLHLLGQVIQRQWPRIELKRHEFSIKVSHDVDQPSLYAFKPWNTIMRMMAGHLIKRRDVKAFITAPYVKMATRNELIQSDPYNTFDWIMDVTEANNLQSAFYFICGRTCRIRDADYEPEHPIIRKLMCRIHERGHEIGLHPSYGTYQSAEAIKLEAVRLKQLCAEEGIEQDQWGGRMHYLRWEQPTTLRAWADAGMNYDSTLGYADRPGFRCGTCYEYPAFDLFAQQKLLLRVRPLIVMECSVIDEVYSGLGIGAAASQLISKLKAHCKAVEGQFALLWHNSYLESIELRNMYKHTVSAENLGFDVPVLHGESILTTNKS